MSGRAAYSSGADAYLGANEASALVGAWRQLGSDVQISTPRGGQERGYDRGYDRGGDGGGYGDNGGGYDRNQSWGGQEQHRHHHHRGERGQRWDQQSQQQYGGYPQPQYQTAQSPYFVRQPAQPQGYGYQQPAPFFAPAARQGGVQVRDHRISGASRHAAAKAWHQRHPGVPFVGVEALMGSVASLALNGGGDSDAGPRPRAWLRDMAPPDMANRQVLPMNTGTTPVPQNSTAQITSRPQRVAFRPERVFVSASDLGGSGNAANWIINDITIGNRSQFAQSGALPGDMFSSVAIDSFVTFETAQTAMDVVMIVTYQGSTEGGTPFYGSIIGTAAV